jgi:hypothetical protein
MMDVMSLPETHATAGETAAAVTVLEGLAKRGRNRASPRADFDNSPVGVVSHDDPAGVARQALGRSSWNVCAVFQPGLTRGIDVLQDFGIDVDHDLEPRSWSTGVELVA